MIRRLGWAVLITAMLASLIAAADHGLDKKQRWDCQHGVAEAC